MKHGTLHMFVLLPALLLLASCRRDMFNQPKSNPLRESDFFTDGAASRPIPPHVVSHDGPDFGEPYDTGLAGTNPVTTFPFTITREVLELGRARFEIACAPCHGLLGEGDGVVVQRGFPAPPSYHIERLREAPVGHFFDVMTRGYGVMYPQGERVTPAERWAIAAYIRALQSSQQAPLSAVPADELARLKSMP